MEFKDKITEIIDEKFYNKLFEDLSDKDIKTYLYHCIIVKYKDHNDIYTIKIDNLKDLIKIKNKEVLVKYYIEKLHYYNKFDNVLYSSGMPMHIYNLGYFLVEGDIKLNDTKQNDLDAMIQKYESNYSNINFELNDEQFLSLNA